METPADSETPQLTPQQKYRQSEKCKVARERYYEKKGKTKAHEYYEKNKEVILARSKERYLQMKNAVLPV
jgi:hypothetical protein